MDYIHRALVIVLLCMPGIAVADYPAKVRWTTQGPADCATSPGGCFDTPRLAAEYACANLYAEPATLSSLREFETYAYEKARSPGLCIIGELYR